MERGAAFAGHPFAGAMFTVGISDSFGPGSSGAGPIPSTTERRAAEPHAAIIAAVATVATVNIRMLIVIILRSRVARIATRAARSSKSAQLLRCSLGSHSWCHVAGPAEACYNRALPLLGEENGSL